MDSSTPQPPASAFAKVVRVPETGSTNSDLRTAVAAEPAAWPHLSVLVTDHQSAGRGRSGRSWETPPGTALTASVLLRPRVTDERLGLGPLVVGLAVKRAIATLTGLPVGLKWPNDVLVLGAGPEIEGWGSDRKVAGILLEALALPPGASAGATAEGEAAGRAIIAGIGVNVSQSAAQLPVPWATSLTLAAKPAGAPGQGAPIPRAAALLEAIGAELAGLLEPWEAGDPRVLDAVRGECVTLGRRVRVELPGDARLEGVAESIEDDGHLVVRTTAAERVRVMAGDVLHVR